MLKIVDWQPTNPVCPRSAPVAFGSGELKTVLDNSKFHFLLNPTALNMAKTPLNFGNSGCNRVTLPSFHKTVKKRLSAGL